MPECKRLADAATSTDALTFLIKRAQDKSAGLSMNAISSRSGIRSRGYLSEVLSGRRRLSQRYLGGLCRTLGLSALENDFLGSLIQQEECRESVGRESIRRRLAGQRLILRNPREALADDFHSKLMLAKVFAAFDVIGESPRLKDFTDLFGMNCIAQIRGALGWLIEHGFAEKDTEAAEATYRLIKKGAFFDRGQGELSHIDFLRATMDDASRTVEKWFEKSDESCLQSFVLSINSQRLQSYIVDLKRRIIDDLASMHDENGDQLLHFNIQVYPASLRKGVSRD